jgi:hypothetical protein
MYERNVEILKQLNEGVEDVPTLAAVFFDVKGIGFRDLVNSRARVPMLGNEHTDYAVIGELEPLFSTNRFIHLLDPVMLDLEDLFNLAPYIQDSPKTHLTEIYKTSKPNEPLPAHMLIPGDVIVETMVFGTGEIQHTHRRTDEFELLRDLLKNKDLISRLKLASRLTIEREVETQVNAWSDLDRYSGRPSLLFSPVYLGEAFSVSTEEKWEKFKKKSQLVTILDVLNEYEVNSGKEIQAMSKADPDFQRRLNGAIENEIEVLRINKDNFFPELQPGSLLELFGSPGFGLYQAIIIHSHPNIYDSPTIEPSIEDLNAIIALRKMHAERGIYVGDQKRAYLECQPLSVIIQPSNKTGTEFSVLVYKEVAGLPYRDKITIPQGELDAQFREIGVVESLELQQFAAVSFSFSRGRFSPGVEKIIEQIKASEQRISEQYYGGSREAVTEMMHEFLLKQRQKEVESLQRWMLEKLYE